MQREDSLDDAPATRNGSLAASPAVHRERIMSLADSVCGEELAMRLRKPGIINRWSDMLSIAVERKIHKEIRSLSKQAYQRQGLLAVIAIVNLALAICVNELCSRVEYVDVREEPLPEYSEQCNGDNASEYIKIVQVVVTIILLAQVYMQERLAYQIAQKEKRLAMGRRKFGMGHDVHVSNWLLLRYVLEFLVCCPINVPWVHHRTHVTMRGLRVEYRLEVYYRNVNLEDSYILQDKETLMLLENSQTNFGFLAFKVAVARKPLKMIATGTGIFLLTIAYLVRLAEGPAGQEHSVYVWDQLWFVCVTLTTTGYGDIVPTTHMGRFAAFFAMAIGPVVTAFITATTTRSLSLSAAEQKVVRALDANSIKLRIVESSAELIQVSRSMRLIHSATTLDIRPRDKQLWDRFYSAVTELKMFERKINPLMTFDPQMQREEEARTGAGERLQLNSRKRNSLSMASVASSQGGGSGRKVAEEVSELRSEVAGVLCEVEGSGARLAALERAVLGLTHSLARVEAALGTAPRPSPPAQASLADHFYATRAAALAQAEAEAEAGGGVGGGLAEGSATAEVLAAEPSAASPWSPPTPSHRRHVPLQSPPSPPVQKAPRGRLVVEEVAASTVSAVDFHLSSSPGAVYASAHRPPQPAGAAPGSAGEGGGLGEGWRGQALPSLPHTRQPQGAQSSPTHALPRPYSLGGAGNGATGQWAPQPYASRSTTLLTSPPEWKH